VLVFPWRVEERALRRVVIVVARVVLPYFFSEGWGRWREMEVPEPGIPDMAIRRRWVGGVVWNLAELRG